jgi:predicted esterase
MKTAENKRIQFLPGLGEKPKEYQRLSKYLKILDVDWNTGKITPPIKKTDILVGFSMGAILACEYALKHKVKNLILCSMTTGVESLEKVKANQIIFLIGEKEKWVIKDTLRISEPLKNKEIYIIPNGDHKIDKNYQKKLIEIIDEFSIK